MAGYIFHRLHPVSTPEGHGPVSPMRPARSRAEIWTDRILLVLEVIFLIELGMLLVVVPWTPLWLHNNLLAGHMTARAFMSNGFVRGAISGLGLINIWIAIWDAVHYEENR